MTLIDTLIESYTDSNKVYNTTTNVERYYNAQDKLTAISLTIFDINN